MKQEIVKGIIATFLKSDIQDINSNTRIDNTSIQGSVLIHRMYSELKQNGYEVNNPAVIKTYGDLEKELFGLSNDHKINIKENKTKKPKNQVPENSNMTASIGIDIESSVNLPETDNYSDDQFYIDNFSKSEIAYCSTKENPRICFTGRFAAKEAIVKADNNYLNTKFSDIEITVDQDGRPSFEGIALSISHVKHKNSELSTAIAQKLPNLDIVEFEKNLTQKINSLSDISQDQNNSDKSKLYFSGLFIILLIITILHY